MSFDTMKEYIVENFSVVDLTRLTSVPMPYADYMQAHRSLVILCHDVFIEYNGGVLLIHRKNYPAKDILWPIGGRVERGIPTEVSLKQKVKNECNLDITDLQILGFSRTFFSTEPFGHNKGTDTFNIVYFGRGVGKIKLDGDHEKPTILYPHEIANDFGIELHPYVYDYLEMIFGFH